MIKHKIFLGRFVMSKKFWLMYAITLFMCGQAYALDLPDSSENTETVTAQPQTNENAQTANTAEPEKKADIKTAPTIADDFTDHINMNKWQYNKEDKVYYQLGITYCRYPEDTKYEKLALFVPDKYMNCSQNADTTYTCSIEKNLNMSSVGRLNSKAAAFIMSINAPGFKAEPALTEYADYTPYTHAGFIYIHAGSRGREHGAPYGVTDLKAAIRYIRHNQDIIPGNTNGIIVSGFSSGGGLAAILGTSGDSALYTPYLQKIGAIEGRASDAIYAVALWNPLTNPDTANEAYEWNFGQTRENMTEEQQKISDSLAKEYAQYINRTGFMLNNHALILQQGDQGVYQAGTYYDYIQSIINEALNVFIRETHFPYISHAYEEKEMYQRQTGKKFTSEDLVAADDKMRTPVVAPLELAGSYLTPDKYLTHLNEKKKWITYSYEARRTKISDIHDFMVTLKPAIRAIGAFDSLSRTQVDNILFGLGDGKGLHFDSHTAKVMEKTPYGKEFSADMKKQDKLGRTVSQRVDMYNPLYFTMPSYMGFRSSKVAPYWRIRTGLSQGDTSLATEVNLFLALQNFQGVKNVDYQAIWGLKHVMAEQSGDSTENFIKWATDAAVRLY